MTDAPTRVLVFQPVAREGAGLDFRLLGAQFWLAERFTGIGLEGASVLMRASAGADPELIATDAPDDPDICDALAANDASFGLVSAYVMRGPDPQLELARLVAVRDDGAVQTLARWSVEGGAEPLASATLRVFVGSCARLGYAIEPVSWQIVFDTEDAVVVGSYFTALGAVSVIEQGFAFPPEDAQVALRAVLSGVRVGMRPALELLPRLVDALRDHDRAPLDMLRAAVDKAYELVDDAPEPWAQMRSSVGGGWVN